MAAASQAVAVFPVAAADRAGSMPSYLRTFLVVITLIFMSVPAALAQSQEERITNFKSDVVVNSDATMNVVEEIEVYVAGQEIQRGILREFPTTYRDRANNTIRVGFDVVSVTRDGQPEPFALENMSNGVRVRIGSGDVLLSTGIHRYTITYKTNRQLGFFDEYDELYWNATGNGWTFAIDKAEAIVRLPPGASLLQQAGYTGFEGDSGQDFVVSDRGDRLIFETTRRLQPNEGLTVAVAWPKGFVEEPSASEKAGFLFRDNLAIAIAFVGTLIVIGYYYVTWDQFGRDPAGSTIFPRFEPPQGFSPAAVRFVHRMSYDRKAFSAALIDMAVKGYLTIEEEGSTYRLKRTDREPKTPLSSGELQIANGLLGSRNSILLKNTQHERVKSGIRSLKTTLDNEYGRRFFVTNWKYFVIGAALSFVIVIATVLLGNASGENLFLGVWLTGWSVGTGMLVVRVFNAWRTAVAGPGAGIGALFGALFITAFSIPFVGAELIVGSLLAASISLVAAAILIALGVINLVFYYLLKAPTRAGRAIMDEIEGFKLYLSVAEQNRLNALNPPNRTPELFEKYLPYALALGVENEWSEQFADVLEAAAAAQTQGGAYRPSWYSGRNWDRFETRSFASSINSSLANTVASSSSAPGSSSGSGGGGSSGGGGGGGGGSGW